MQAKSAARIQAAATFGPSKRARPALPTALRVVPLLLIAVAGCAADGKSPITPFQWIDEGHQQATPATDSPYSIPRYGISGQAQWSSAHETDQGLRVEPAAGEGQLLRLACKLDGVWRLIPTRSKALSLELDETASKQLAEHRPDCVTENVDGHVVNVSLPFALSDSRGSLLLAVILLPLIAWPFSCWLLRRFDRSVRRTLENDCAEEPEPDVAPAKGPPFPTRELGVEASSAVFELARSSRRKKIAIYALVVASCALLLAHAWLTGSGAAWSVSRYVALATVCAWPLVPTLAPLLTSRRAVWRAALVYAVLFGALTLWVGRSVLLLLAISVPGAIGVLTLLWPKTRAAQGWVLFAFIALLVGVNVPFVFLQDERNLRPFTELAFGLGLSAWSAIALSVGISLAAVGLVFWFAASAGAAIFRKLRLNSRLMSLASFWLLYCVAEALLIGARDAATLRLALRALLPIIGALAIAVVLTARQRMAGPRVLYLRCFHEGSKNATLLSRLELWLASVARIDLIAGPDLASALVEPQELLDFLARKTGRAYLRTVADFERALALQDSRADAEGGLPIRDYFCGNAIWKEAFRRLAAGAAAVVIDARGLRAGHSGTAFELTELIHRVPLHRVVIVASTVQAARERLDAILSAAWSSLPADSPNRDAADPVAHLFTYQDGGETRLLAQHLCGLLRPSGALHD